jgi:DNA invertase Pin-like site-specific DNA recombinase
MAAIIYTRFSPGADSEASRSGDVQKDQCELYCYRNGLDIDDVYADESKSGADEAREPLWDAINALKKGDVLVVYNRDRLARSLFLAEYIRRKVAEKGATIAAVTGDIEGDNPETTLIRQILDAVAEYERKIIARRTSASMRQLIKQGYKVGGKPPYGWRVAKDDLTLEKDPQEQKILALIKDYRAKGFGYNKIAGILNQDRATAARGGEWHGSTLRRIIGRFDREPTV